MKHFPFVLLLLFAFLSGCGNRLTHGPEEHGHAPPEEEAVPNLSYTLYSGKTELFVEFKPLVAGQSTRFATHVTRLGEHFTPLTKGSVIVSLIKRKKGLRNTAKAPFGPGTFRPELTPKEAGTYQLVFDVAAPGIKDRHVIEPVTVYADEKAALADEKKVPAGSSLSFSKEQAWRTEFANEPVQLKPFQEVFKASGQIMPSQGDEQQIIAKTSGIIRFGSNSLLAGTKVRVGELLFRISGNGVTGSENVDARYKEAQAEYRKAKADYDRARELVKDQLISQRDFQEAKLRYGKAQAQAGTFSGYGSGGQQVKAPASGFLSNVLVKEGQFVEQGQPLATVSGNQRLILRAEVSQKHFELLPQVRSANFRSTYNNRMYSTDSLNGKVVSYGKSTESASFFTPVFFEIDNNGQLIPGTFVEVFLKTKAVKPALSVPQTALVEEQGTFSVYVQTGGESFEKREVKLGSSNGQEVQVLSGIQAGERVVTKGAQQIRLSTMPGAMPGHGHEH
jgi:cobalt-zinc-cadmium efflux system membrane fusion protein